MTETTTPSAQENTPAQTETVPSRLQRFGQKHPRAKKAAVITVGALATIGVVQTARTMKANKGDLESAAENIQEAGQDLASSVTPKSPEA